MLLKLLHARGSMHGQQHMQHHGQQQHGQQQHGHSSSSRMGTAQADERAEARAAARGCGLGKSPLNTGCTHHLSCEGLGACTWSFGHRLHIGFRVQGLKLTLNPRLRWKRVVPKSESTRHLANGRMRRQVLKCPRHTDAYLQHHLQHVVLQHQLHAQSHASIHPPQQLHPSHD